MAKPVEITIPTKASGKAQASIPGDEVPRVAKALRRSRPDIAQDATDEEVVAEGIMQILRDEVRAFERSEAVRAALEQVKTDDTGF